MKKGANLGTGVAIPPSKRNLQIPTRTTAPRSEREKENKEKRTSCDRYLPGCTCLERNGWSYDTGRRKFSQTWLRLLGGGGGQWEGKKKKVSRPSEHAQGPWTLDQTRARPPPLERGSAKSLTNKIRTGRPAPPLPGRSSAPRAQDLAATGPAPARLATALGALERQALKPVLGAGA